MTSRLPAIQLLLVLGLLPTLADAGPAGTLDRLADRIDARVGEELAGKPPASLDLALAMQTLAATPPQLASVLRGLLLTRLRARGLRSLVLVPAEVKQSARRRWAGDRGLELLLEVDVTIRDGHLHLIGVLRSCERDFWRDPLYPRTDLLNHLNASARVDAEVRAYLGAVTTGRLRLSLTSTPMPHGAALALGAGDLDGDGRDELVVLHHRGLVRGWRSGGRNKELTPGPPGKLLGGAGSQLGTVAPASLRPRRAMGVLVVADLDGDGKAEVLLRSSDMARGAVLTMTGRALEIQRELDGYPLAWRPSGVILTCQAVAGMDLLDGKTVTPGGGGSPPALPATLYSYREAVVARKGAPPVSHRGSVDAAGRLLLVSPGAAPGEEVTAKLQRAGAAFHLADLDDDGTLEVITTGAGGPEEEDRIEIRTLAGGKLSPVVWSSGLLKGVVTALTHGDLDGDGKLELVGAVLGQKGAARLVVLR